MAAREAAFHQLRRDLLDQVGSAVAVALDHCLAYEEVRDLRDRLVRENVYLQEEIRREHPFEELVGSSPTLGAASAASSLPMAARSSSTRSASCPSRRR